MTNTSKFPDGTLGHLAHAANNWLIARKLEQQFTGDLDTLQVIAPSLSAAQEEFLRAAHLATKNGLKVWGYDA